MRNKNAIRIVAFICRIIDKTLRKTSLNETLRYPVPAIYPFWHGNSLPMMFSNQKNKIVVMVSLSKDGQLFSQILQRFGYLTVRGSSSRGGEKALIEIIRYAKKGYSLAFAADGPKGPYHKLKPGVVYAAQKTGMPLVAISCSPKNKITLGRSWDKTVIPFPFSKTVQIYDEPVYVKPSDNVEEKTVFIEKKLNRIFEFADKYYWRKDIIKYLEYHPCPKILIVQPSRLGDIVFSLPVLAAIKKRYPHAKISWVVDKRCAGILEDNPCLENVFIWDKARISLKYYGNLRQCLRRQKFDLSIDLHGLAKSAMLVAFSGARFKIASSSTNGMKEFSQLFSKEIKSPKTCHCLERHFETAKYLDCSYATDYPIVILEENYESVREKLIGLGVDMAKIIGMHPGAGWVSRRWGGTNFAGLAKRIKTELDADVVIVGGKEGGTSEEGLNEEIIVAAGVKIADMTGKFSLKELCAFLKMCRVFVGNEAGPVHIATALNTPSVAILGPTNAKLTGPYKGNTVVMQHKIDCQPCKNRNCGNPVCMDKITVTEVFEQVKKLFKG